MKINSTFTSRDDERTIEHMREMVWTGQHVQAVQLATETLRMFALEDSLHMDLLELRMEAHIAQGNFELALNDTTAMLALAHSNPSNTALLVQALNCRSNIQMRLGDVQDAIETAKLAIAHARPFKGKERLRLAHAYLRLAEAQKLVSEYKGTIKNAEKAIALFNSLGDISNSGRAHWVMSPAYNVLGNAKRSRQAALTAYELCSKAGDHYGMGNALNALSSTDADIADRILHYQQSIVALEKAGYLERQSTATGNLGFTYLMLGLYPHARRYTQKALAMDKEMGAKVGMAFWLENLLEIELRMGILDSARARLHEMNGIVPGFGDPRMNAGMETNHGNLALAESKPDQAIIHFEKAVEIAEDAGVGNENVHLTLLAHAHLMNHDPESALAASTRATKLHKAQKYKLPDSFSSQEIWLRHTQALFATGRQKEASAALNLAYNFLLEAMAGVRDEGLRRNYINKAAANRELLQLWVQEGIKKKLPREKLMAHLAVETNPREPFKRLTDTALRLNALHKVKAIHAFLVEETTELCGGERVLFILEEDEQRESADFLLPRGEDPNALLRSIAHLLIKVRHTRSAHLMPAQFHKGSSDERNRLIAPLISQNQVLGYLYTDMDPMYGSFTETDRDMLGMLANQAAVALDNVNWAQGLEHKVQGRTAELNTRLEELAIINSVQAALATQLDVNAIYELIGEQLRGLFESQAITVASFDKAKNIRHYHYILEKGMRLDIPDGPIAELSHHIIRNKKILLINENYLESLAAIGIEAVTLPGTLAPKSLLRVPILVDDQVQGIIGIDNIDRENAFSDSDIRLLTTLASSMSVALKNARLYQQAQEASAAKSAFLANMSHELRTPLNAIIGFTRIVRRKSENILDEKQIENLDKVLNSGEHLLGLINSVLDIAKIEAGRMEVYPARFSLNMLLDQCTRITAPRLKSGVELKNLSETSNIMMNSDQEKIKQILLNVLSNAAKFTEQGEISVSCESYENNTALVKISDTGIGISEEALPLVFGEFQQVDSSTTRKYGGTGLGLTISRNLARLLGGDLTVTSQVGKGSTFTLTLPLHFISKTQA